MKCKRCKQERPLSVFKLCVECELDDMDKTKSKHHDSEYESMKQR